MSDELIKKSEVLVIFENLQYDLADSDMNLVDIAKKVVEDMPATVVRDVRCGKWIGHYDDILCSICHKRFNVCNNDTYKFKHCPNCGAKMELWCCVETEETDNE